MRLWIPIAALALGACASLPLIDPHPVPDHETHVTVTSGNVELIATDGTEVHVAPGSALALDISTGPGDIGHLRLDEGHVHVSNVGHRHGDVMHVGADRHTFVLNRARAVIAHTPDGIHATLIEGRHLGAIGHDIRVTGAGHQIRLGQVGLTRNVPEAAEVAALLKRTSAPVSR